MSRSSDPYEARCREMAQEQRLDPDARVRHPHKPDRTMPMWCSFREAARAEHVRKEQEAFRAPSIQPVEYQNGPVHVFGEHDGGTIAQLHNCMKVGKSVAGVLCADGHLGYAQPVGGVIAYEDQISISGVGFDIACGNQAVKLDLRFDQIKDQVKEYVEAIAKHISFGVGRVNSERVDHELFDDAEAWKKADREEYKDKARAQLGTVGSGNHYVDLMEDENGFVWIGVHFGSRGLGHTSATKYLKAVGGKDGMNVPPAIVDAESEIGQRYLAAMELSGRYAYAGREWVVRRVTRLLGDPAVLDMVHNHHNYAWKECHSGRMLYVVRKGATPAFPGQRGFVGGSMGDDAVIIEGIDSEQAKTSLYSTVHGAGRLFSRKEAKRQFDRREMDRWLHDRGAYLIGGDLDESPMAYRRLPEVLAQHADSIRIKHTLRPFGIVMAGDTCDPWKD